MIYKKLLDFQKLNISVSKVGKANYGTYATINEVLEKVKKPLNDMDIVIIQIPQETGLLTRLIDTEDYDGGIDSFVECFMPYINATDSQKLGSANTYVRRYSLVTLLGLESEDDDGQSASISFDTKLGKDLAGNSGYTPKNYEKKALEDGALEVLITDKRNKHDDTTGELVWERVNTDQGGGFNNSGVELIVGCSYSVVVKNGAIVTAAEL